MNAKQKLFAFKLTTKEDAKQATVESQGKWKAQDGVATAGCSLVKATGDYRASVGFGRDNGIYC